MPKSWKIETQTWRANTQPTKRWLIVFSAWSQRGQTSRCGRPRFAKWSAVQHRLWTTNQMKNLQRRGGPTLPNSSPRTELDCSDEEGGISGLAALRAWLGFIAATRRQKNRIFRFTIQILIQQGRNHATITIARAPAARPPPPTMPLRATVSALGRPEQAWTETNGGEAEPSGGGAGSSSGDSATAPNHHALRRARRMS